MVDTDYLIREEAGKAFPTSLQRGEETFPPHGDGASEKSWLQRGGRKKNASFLSQ